MKEIDTICEKSDTEMWAKILMFLLPEYSKIVIVEKEKPNKSLSKTQKSLICFCERKFKSIKNDSKEVVLVNVKCYCCSKLGYESNQCKVK